jgi:hypothetical protein
MSIMRCECCDKLVDTDEWPMGEDGMCESCVDADITEFCGSNEAPRRMAETLAFAEEYWAHRSGLYKNRQPVDVPLASAVLKGVKPDA